MKQINKAVPVRLLVLALVPVVLATVGCGVGDGVSGATAASNESATCEPPNAGRLDLRNQDLAAMGPVDAEVVMTSSDLEGARALDFLDELAETLGDVPINPDTANHETELVLATAQVEWLVSGDHIRPSTNGRAAVLLLQSQAEVIRQAGEPVTLFGDSVLRNGPAISQSFAEDSPLSNSSFLYLWSPVLRKDGETIVEEGRATCMGRALIQDLDDLSAAEMERVSYEASGARG